MILAAREIKKAAARQKFWFARERKKQEPRQVDQEQASPAAPDKAKPENGSQNHGEPRASPEGEFLPQQRPRPPQRLRRENSATCRPTTECSGKPAPTATIQRSMPQPPQASTGGKIARRATERASRIPKGESCPNPAPATPEGLSVAQTQEYWHVHKHHGSAARSRSHSDHSRQRRAP